MRLELLNCTFPLEKPVVLPPITPEILQCNSSLEIIRDLFSNRRKYKYAILAQSK